MILMRLQGVHCVLSSCGFRGHHLEGTLSLRSPEKGVEVGVSKECVCGGLGRQDPRIRLPFGQPGHIPVLLPKDSTEYGLYLFRPSKYRTYVEVYSKPSWVRGLRHYSIVFLACHLCQAAATGGEVERSMASGWMWVTEPGVCAWMGSVCGEGQLWDGPRRRSVGLWT